PALDLSADNGKVTVVLTAAATTAGSFISTGSIGLALVDADDNMSGEKVVDLDVKGFGEYTVTLEGGTAESKVKIYDVNGNTSVRFFFDDITVSQVKPAGFISTFNYLNDEVEATEFSGSIEADDNAAYYITVTAAARTSSGGSLSTVYSAPSEEKLIAGFSGVENVSVGAADNIAVRSIGGGMIEVISDADAVVEVYDLSGRRIASAAVSAGVNVIDVKASGIVIAKAGGVVAKIVL
ncbi:MAG: hypothetical protein K2I25_03265, partial [Muribaculaceae bacterium]|nr:hypothetical protein [Muribaculaceae bacterium]